MVWRITTLIVSDAPTTAIAPMAKMTFGASPNKIVPMPNIVTVMNMTRPTRSETGQRASTSPVTMAPTAGAARNAPKPSGPMT